MGYYNRRSKSLPLILCGVAIGAAFTAYAPVFAQERGFTGGIQEDRDAAAAEPIAVRNDVAQPGEEIVTFRHFRIEKGRFDEFYEASEQGVWPFFEKIGARVVGMWVRVHPVVDGEAVSEGSADYDDVYLMTRYASVAHWRATRDMAKHGGNGPDWAKCREALAFRRSITQESTVMFLQGHKWDNPPWFLPGLDEQYERVN
jgi:hypothetical protein